MWTNRAYLLAVGLRIFSAQVQVRSQGSPCRIYGRHYATGTVYSPRIFVFPYQLSCHRHVLSLMYHLRVATGSIDGPGSRRHIISPQLKKIKWRHTR